MKAYAGQAEINDGIILMRCYAAQVRHTEDSLRGFGADWDALIQPVIASGDPHDDRKKNWAAFSLLVHYLSDEGASLPLCTKPWIAAMRLFRAIAGDECPSSLQATEYPFWSGCLGDFSHHHAFTSIDRVRQVAGFLGNLSDELNDISLSWLRDQMADTASPELPHECGVFRALCDAVVFFRSAEGESDTPEDLQSDLLAALEKSGKYTRSELADSHRRAAGSSARAQLDILVRSVTSTQNDRGYQLSNEVCAARFSRQRIQGDFPALEPFREAPMPAVFFYPQGFPGKLANAPWVGENKGMIKPPDPLRLWIARNWVNPQCPLWLMTLPTVEAIAREIGLPLGVGDAASLVRQSSRAMESLTKDGVRKKHRPVNSVSFSPYFKQRMAASGGDPEFAVLHPGAITVTPDLRAFVPESAKEHHLPGRFSIKSD